jgi:CTP:molybdopterin cytidylyltransferase MocA
MGRPKALVELDGEPLVRRALRVLADGGCGPLVVVLGAAADEVRTALPPGVRSVVAGDWESGMGASLRAGLDAIDPDAGSGAALVHLVDLPGVTAEAVSRLIAGQVDTNTLRRATYDGRPAHPVLLGRAHWAGVRAAATGDAGARGYLAGHPGIEPVEVGDVAAPEDVDTPEQLARFRQRGPADGGTPIP